MLAYIILIINSMLVANMVFHHILGICPYVGVSRRIDTALGMGMAVMFVMTLSSLVTYAVQIMVLDRIGLEYLQTLTFILVIASLVQLVEMILKKYSQPLYRALGIYLPLITTNCAVLGVAILNIRRGYNLLEVIVFSIGSSAGFALALIIFAGIRERLALCRIPRSFQGFPIALVTAGILSLAFLGFAGLAK
ncbi:MAG TPA: electron transport complex subunit RsxA [Candidatus Sumerlaeota bacterium]|nr:electron transport complex subunit RsxA [Candidatus Sumerlaeota bacterium]